MRNLFLIDIGKLIIAVVVCEGVGALGGLATASSVQGWYRTLQKPAFAPPDWVFGPVWTMLYLMMGIAAFLVWRRGPDQRPVRLALILFILQLILNGIWSPAFFGLRSPVAGLIVILLLLPAIIATLFAFRPISRAAAALMVPYALWVAFATALNASFAALNR